MAELVKITSPVREMAEAVARLCQFVPTAKGGSRPYLANVLVKTDGAGAVDLYGTDLEIAMRLRVTAAAVVHEGAVLANAAKILQILREFSGETLTLEADVKSGCWIKVGGASFHILGDDLVDYPALPTTLFDDAVTLPAKDLAYMISRTSFAASEENTRYGRKGVLIEAKEGLLRLVSTDSKRLALCERPYAQQLDKPVSAIVMTDGLLLLKSAITAEDENVAVKIGDSLVYFKTKNASLSARLVEGNFPPYERLLGIKHQKSVDIDRKAFQTALKRASLLCGRDTTAIKFSFGKNLAGDGGTKFAGLMLTTRALDTGESGVPFAFDFPYDERLDVGFDPGHFQDLIKVLETPKVRFTFGTHNQPAMLREIVEVEGKLVDKTDFLYVIMPMEIA